MPDLSDDQFDQFKPTPKERGEALGSIMWNMMEELAGGKGAMRRGFVREAWDTASKGGWEGHEFINDPDDDDAFPSVKIPLRGGYFGKYQPGSGIYLDIHHEDDPESAVDTLHIDPDYRNDPAAVRRRGMEHLEGGGEDDLNEMRRW